MSTTKYVIVSVKGGDQFEQGSFTDKNAAIEDTVASYHALSDHDKKKLDSIM